MHLRALFGMLCPAVVLVPAQIQAPCPCATKASSTTLAPLQGPCCDTPTSASQALGDGTCAPAELFTEAFKQASTLVESAHLQLLAASRIILAAGQAEASARLELSHLREVALEELRSCERTRAGAQREVESYERALRELAEIARADERAPDLPPVSLLGMHTVTVRNALDRHRSSVSAAGNSAEGVLARRMALMKAARALARCRKRAGLGEDFADWDMPATGTFSAADPPECQADRAQLNLAYQTASLQVQGLLKAAKAVLCDEDSCFRGAATVFDDQRAMLELKISGAQRQLCEGQRAGEAAETEVSALRLKVGLGADLLTAACAHPLWQRFVGEVERLEQLVRSRPQMPEVCNTIVSK